MTGDMWGRHIVLSMYRMPRVIKLKNKKMKKLSSYQKLKKHNHDLMQDIILLVDKPNSIEGIRCKMKYKIAIDTERLLWAGKSSYGR
jgi:hypothetical protein